MQDSKADMQAFEQEAAEEKLHSASARLRDTEARLQDLQARMHALPHGVDHVAGLQGLPARDLPPPNAELTITETDTLAHGVIILIVLSLISLGFGQV